MVKYAKSLYWASLIVYGTGAVIFPMLYLKSGKLTYIGMELIFIVMLLKNFEITENTTQTAKIIQMKLNETHWLIKFLIGIGAGLAIGLGLSTPVIGVIIAIYVGTALTRGTWKV